MNKFDCNFETGELFKITKKGLRKVGFLYNEKHLCFVMYKKYVYVKDIVYMLYHNLQEIPKGYKVICKNKNFLDTRINNLELIQNRRTQCDAEYILFRTRTRTEFDRKLQDSEQDEINNYYNSKCVDIRNIACDNINLKLKRKKR